MTKLTDRQAIFCKEYLIDLNATQSAIRAGYSEDSARQLGSDTLSKVYIQAEIQKLMTERSKKVEITAEYVINGIKSVIERCNQEEQVYDKNGNPTGEYVFKEAGALRGYELLGKHLKLFRDQIDIKVQHSGTVEGYQDMDDFEYLQHIKNRLGKHSAICKN